MSLKDKVKLTFRKIFSELYMRQDHVLLLLGKMHSKRIMECQNINSLEDVEFKVYSQWGDDGIIQYLINNIDIPNKIFIEFGVQNYTESNTRFLLQNDNWSGLVMDGSEEAINYIKNDEIHWKYDLTAKKAFITKDNINKLIIEYTTIKNIGLLSIDIDGNDYWIWENIECISPRIVICEYNANFGREKAVTIPYKDDFYRTSAHFSNLYFGASYKALLLLSEKKGYKFVGCNSNGNNMYFVKKEYSDGFDNLETRFIDSKFKEARDKNGLFLDIPKLNTMKVIEEEMIYNLETNGLQPLKELIL
ncbi:hypothetical protein SMGD1_0509 [Sulfurimonas gotlandica GD1]|uniref:Methyltransferase FkbM domain-containing protein n=1 Tax=Sulfurimonas gotlandica (strain DSM 19862 / JCM 16533 / GD1) TaxID=929558 RepID=B6BKI1_SULGG|nr:hypothetical protein [Sulfurimonas gotlandica]EDZ62224.1 conserved hypothetical protein [Sulfurimonas gotlandica GD1]EHP29036.1 hypothetical protein SMGD1_0509 [Sulfurimonas gotlandica GD1]